MTITEFLNARLDEEEAVARAADTGRLRSLSKRHAMTTGDAWFMQVYTPDLVLHQIEAKRSIIERYERALGVPASVASFTRGQDGGYREACWDAILDAASVYADHPDYQQEWAP